MKKSISIGTKVRRTEESPWQQRLATIGIDLSDRSSQCCAIGREGEIVAQFRVATNASAFNEAFRGIDPTIIAIGQLPEATIHLQEPAEG